MYVVLIKQTDNISPLLLKMSTEWLEKIVRGTLILLCSLSPSTSLPIFSSPWGQMMSFILQVKMFSIQHYCVCFRMCFNDMNIDTELKLVNVAWVIIYWINILHHVTYTVFVEGSKHDSHSLVVCSWFQMFYIKCNLCVVTTMLVLLLVVLCCHCTAQDYLEQLQYMMQATVCLWPGDWLTLKVVHAIICWN